MRDAEKTVGNMIDKLKTAFIGSIDREGFPNIKAMLQPRKKEEIFFRRNKSKFITKASR